jgi:hypothetical protein
MLEKPDLCYEMGGRQPAGESPQLRETFERPSPGKKAMINYVSVLLETDAAKRRLSELFESETLRPLDCQSAALGDCERTRVPRRTTDKYNNTLQERGGCTQTLVRGRTIRVVATSEPSLTKGDMSVFGFMLTLVMVGVVLAAHSDRPLLWLLVGPTPLILIHAMRTLLRWRMIRREGLLTFSERSRR